MTNAPKGPTQSAPRRDLLKSLVVAPVAIPMVAAGCANAKTAVSEKSGLAAATMGLISSNVCTVMPATTEGPYYIDPKLVRKDIAEDKSGIPLQMNIQVVDSNCQPLANARVDIWQCDAAGYYSGYENMGSARDQDTTGKTFLRGTQTTDSNGIVTFNTIYPGWYQGRTTHIHYKVFLNEKTVLTSQIFFPDALSEYIYLKHEGYERSEQRDTLNAVDGIAEQAGQGAYCAIREQKDRYIAAMVVGVDPSATWSEGGQGMGGPPPPGFAAGERPAAPPPEGSRRGPPPGGMPGGPRGNRVRNDADAFPKAG